uniref:G_PROTEIN_RECEP_F3_4 domain-containing protein n=1 Tax=Strongyloides stercoralis TaxID=6248 RepID=A0A0K0ELG9_STRER
MLVCLPVADIETFMNSTIYSESNTSSTKIVDVNPFYYNHQKYKCLCKKVHIKVGTYCFAYLTIFGYTIVTILAWILGTHPIISITTTILAILGIISALLLIYSVKKEKRQFSLPYLIFCILSGALLITFVILCIFTLLNRENENIKNFLYPNQENHKLSNNQDDYLVTNLSIYITIALVFLFFTIWAFFIVFRTYKFIKDILIARRPIRVIKNTE